MIRKPLRTVPSVRDEAIWLRLNKASKPELVIQLILLTFHLVFGYTIHTIDISFNINTTRKLAYKLLLSYRSDIRMH